MSNRTPRPQLSLMSLVYVLLLYFPFIRLHLIYSYAAGSEMKSASWRRRQHQHQDDGRENNKVNSLKRICENHIVVRYVVYLYV